VTSGSYGDQEPRVLHDPPLLYDLSVDPGEHFDVAASHPDIVQQLITLLDAHRKSVVPTRPLFDVLLTGGKD
jgi:arylsulfatase A